VKAFLFSTLFLISVNLHATSVEDRLLVLEEEISMLKGQVNESKKIGILNSKRLNLGGYFIFQAESINSNQSANSFRKIETELIISGELIDRWTYFNEVEIEHESGLDKATKHTADRFYTKHQDIIKLERAWINYEKSDLVNIKAGLMFSPIGYMNRTHYKPVILGTDRALFLRNNMISRTFSGTSIWGRSKRLLYEVYGGSNPTVDETPFVGGARLEYEFAYKKHIAFSNHNTRRADKKYTTVNAIDIHSEWKNFNLTIEYLKDNLEGEGYYIEPSYRQGSWQFFYRYDFADIDVDVDQDDDYHRQILGVNHLISGNKRLKLDYQLYDYKIKKDSNNKNKDFSKITFELAFTF
jgi:hypothetical protein